jgi:hypothetical protein
VSIRGYIKRIMKNVLLAIVAIALFGYLGWHWFAPAPKPPPPVARPQAQRTPPKPVAAVRSTPAKSQPAKPTPAARSVAVKEPRLAPEGTYFLLRRVSLKIDSGVVGFAPGTKVTMIEQGDPLSTVSDGQYQFGVPSFQLTNDLNIAEDVAKSDYAAQSQIAAGIGQSVRWYEQQQRDAIAAEEKEKAEKKKGQKAPAPRKSPSPTPR